MDEKKGNEKKLFGLLSFTVTTFVDAGDYKLFKYYHFFFIGFLKAYFLVVSKSLFEQDSDERAINILFMALLLHA